MFIKETCLAGGLTLLVDGFLCCVSGSPFSWSPWKTCLHSPSALADSLLRCKAHTILNIAGNRKYVLTPRHLLKLVLKIYIYAYTRKKKKKAITCWNQWSPAFNTNTCLIFLEMNIEFFKTRLLLMKKSKVLAEAKRRRWCQNYTGLVLSKQLHACWRGILPSCFYFLSRKASVGSASLLSSPSSCQMNR